VTSFGQLAATVRSQWISPSDVRAEAWALGGRHRGRVFEGAQLELKAGGISVRRAVLLKAVIRSLRR
jgi:hypothetical protein